MPVGLVQNGAQRRGRLAMRSVGLLEPACRIRPTWLRLLSQQVSWICPESSVSSGNAVQPRFTEKLGSSKEPVVFMVGADPKPHDVTPVQDAESAVVGAYARRVHRTPLAHTLEIEA